MSSSCIQKKKYIYFQVYREYKHRRVTIDKANTYAWISEGFMPAEEERGTEENIQSGDFFKENGKTSAGPVRLSYWHCYLIYRY